MLNLFSKSSAVSIKIHEFNLPIFYFEIIHIMDIGNKQTEITVLNFLYLVLKYYKQKKGYLEGCNTPEYYSLILDLNEQIKNVEKEIIAFKDKDTATIKLNKELLEQIKKLTNDNTQLLKDKNDLIIEKVKLENDKIKLENDIIKLLAEILKLKTKYSSKMGKSFVLDHSVDDCTKIYGNVPIHDFVNDPDEWLGVTGNKISYPSTYEDVEYCNRKFKTTYEKDRTILKLERELQGKPLDLDLEECKKLYGDPDFKIERKGILQINEPIGWLQNNKYIKLVDKKKTYDNYDKIRKCNENVRSGFINEAKCIDVVDVIKDSSGILNLNLDNRDELIKWLNAENKKISGKSEYYNKVNDCLKKEYPYKYEKDVDGIDFEEFDNNVVDNGNFKPSSANPDKTLLEFYRFLREADVGSKWLYIEPGFPVIDPKDQHKIYDYLTTQNLIDCTKDNYGLDIIRVNVGGTAFAYPVFAKFDSGPNKGLYTIKIFLQSKDPDVMVTLKPYQLAYREIDIYEKFLPDNTSPNMIHVMKGKEINATSPCNSTNPLLLKNLGIKTGNTTYQKIELGDFLVKNCDSSLRNMVYGDNSNYYNMEKKRIVQNIVNMMYGTSKYLVDALVGSNKIPSALNDYTDTSKYNNYFETTIKFTYSKHGSIVKTRVFNGEFIEKIQKDLSRPEYPRQVLPIITTKIHKLKEALRLFVRNLNPIEIFKCLIFLDIDKFRSLENDKVSKIDLEYAIERIGFPKISENETINIPSSDTNPLNTLKIDIITTERNGSYLSELQLYNKPKFIEACDLIKYIKTSWPTTGFDQPNIENILANQATTKKTDFEIINKYFNDSITIDKKIIYDEIERLKIDIAKYKLRVDAYELIITDYINGPVNKNNIKSIHDFVTTIIPLPKKKFQEPIKEIINEILKKKKYVLSVIDTKNGSCIPPKDIIATNTITMAISTIRYPRSCPLSYDEGYDGRKIHYSTLLNLIGKLEQKVIMTIPTKPLLGDKTFNDIKDLNEWKKLMNYLLGKENVITGGVYAKNIEAKITNIDAYKEIIGNIKLTVMGIKDALDNDELTPILLNEYGKNRNPPAVNDMSIDITNLTDSAGTPLIQPKIEVIPYRNKLDKFTFTQTDIEEFKKAFDKLIINANSNLAMLEMLFISPDLKENIYDITNPIIKNNVINYFKKFKITQSTINQKMKINLENVTNKIISEMDIRKTAININKNNYSVMLLNNMNLGIDNTVSIISPKDRNYIGYAKQVINMKSGKLEPQDEKKMRFCTENKIQTNNYVARFLLLEFLGGGSYCDFINNPLVTDTEIISSIFQILFQMEYLLKKYKFYQGDLHINNLLLGIDPNYEVGIPKHYKYTYTDYEYDPISKVTTYKKKSIYIPVRKLIIKIFDFDKSLMLNDVKKNVGDIITTMGNSDYKQFIINEKKSVPNIDKSAEAEINARMTSGAITAQQASLELIKLRETAIKAGQMKNVWGTTPVQWNMFLDNILKKLGLDGACFDSIGGVLTNTVLYKDIIVDDPGVPPYNLVLAITNKIVPEIYNLYNAFMTMYNDLLIKLEDLDLVEIDKINLARNEIEPVIDDFIKFADPMKLLDADYDVKNIIDNSYGNTAPEFPIDNTINNVIKFIFKRGHIKEMYDKLTSNKFVLCNKEVLDLNALDESYNQFMKDKIIVSPGDATLFTASLLATIDNTSTIKKTVELGNLNPTWLSYYKPGFIKKFIAPRLSLEQYCVDFNPSGVTGKRELLISFARGLAYAIDILGTDKNDIPVPNAYIEDKFYGKELTDHPTLKWSPSKITLYGKIGKKLKPGNFASLMHLLDDIIIGMGLNVMPIGTMMNELEIP